MEKSYPRNLIAYLTFFGVAMAFLEAAVVVYLRELYYPNGFSFPLAPMAFNVLSVEYLREASTIIMLVCMGMLSGRTFPERLAGFLYSFGVWDIFYYIWLRALLDWPHSLFTWDILFLIPVVWVGPVLAPVICSLTMIAISLCIWNTCRMGYYADIAPREWALLISGAFLIFITFITDYLMLIIRGGFLSRIWTLNTDSNFQRAVSHYVPDAYNWELFFIGEALLIAAIVLFNRRLRLQRNEQKGGLASPL
ncbi:MAG TPA: hypothetical protein VF790_09405 [Dissulfurispiraceae bacterium]